MEEKKESGKKQYKTLRAYLVYDYIFKKTESDWFTTTQINEYLQLFGIECDNRSIVRDIEAINQAYIMSREELDSVEEADKLLRDKENQIVYNCSDLGSYVYSVNRENYHRDDFSMIAECIGAARFINTAETERLINIMCNWLHPKTVKEIKENITFIQREKVRCGVFHQNLVIINKIINYNNKYNYCNKLWFEYLTYDIEYLGKPLAKHKKEEYLVFPHKIINSDGLYYLIAYDITKRKMRSFRVDRINKARDYCGETQDGIRLAGKMDFPTLAARTFDMCMGESTRVTIRCSNSIFDTIYERFGTDGVSYHKCDDNHFEISVVLDVSPKFFGWLCGFGKDAKLVSPPSIVDEFANYLDEIKSQY